MDNVKISNWQAVFLIVHTIFPTAFLTVPSAVAKNAYQSGWISVLIATSIALIFVFITSTISQHYPNKTIFEIAETLLGSKVSKLLGLLLAFYYFQTSFYVIYQFGDFMTAQILTETPTLAIHILHIIVVTYALYLGLEVIARTNFLIFGLTLFSYSISTLLIVKDMKFENLLPMNEIPFSNILLGAYAPLGWLSEGAIIWLLAPYLLNKESIRKTALWGVLLTGVMLTFTIIGTIAVSGVDQLLSLNYPSFKVFKEISVGKFIERIDAIFMGIWTATIIMKTILFMFGAVYCFCEPFKIKQRGPILIPFAILSIIYAEISWENTTTLNTYSAYTFPTFVLFFNVLIPILLFLVHLIKKKTASANSKSS
jgi:spore germination protein KB